MLFDGRRTSVQFLESHRCQRLLLGGGPVVVAPLAAEVDTNHDGDDRDKGATYR